MLKNKDIGQAQTNLNILQKISVVRLKLANQKIQKTGFNAHTNHHYYETADFLPCLNKLCDEIGIFLKQDFYEKYATLSVFNMENNKEEPVVFKMEYLGDIANDSVRMANIQKYGAILTYLERYLYSKAFAITEDDTYDALRSEKPNLLQKIKNVSNNEVLEAIWNSLSTIYQEDTDLKNAYQTSKQRLKPKLSWSEIQAKLINVKSLEELHSLWESLAEAEQKTEGIRTAFQEKKRNLYNI